MKTKRIYMCEDSIDGIFTAIYDAWSSKYGHDNIRIDIQKEENQSYNIELFSEYIHVITDHEKAIKVANSIKNKISMDAFDMACHAAWSDSDDKGDVIYRFLILGFAVGAKIVDSLANDVVMKIFTMNRNVDNEAHHFLGFIRFSESSGNILLSKIKPQNDILRLLAPHFSDRLSNENFIIYDETRKTAIVHKTGYPWIYTLADNLKLEKFSEYSEQEEEFQNLWKTFFDSIAITERKNKKLQQSNLPKRFHDNIIEFNKNYK